MQDEPRARDSHPPLATEVKRRQAEGREGARAQLATTPSSAAAAWPAVAQLTRAQGAMAQGAMVAMARLAQGAMAPSPSAR